MRFVICPGSHDEALTQDFLTGLRQIIPTEVNFNPLVFPADRYPAYSSAHILKFLFDQAEPLPCFIKQSGQPSPRIGFIAFSAGVAGAIGAAWIWQSLGGQVSQFIAVDGWGVPLYGNFPIHRISHDRFTHWSSAWLGAGESGFYADPAVEHLEVWRSPQLVQGWWTPSPSLLGRLDHPSPYPTSRFTTVAELIWAIVASHPQDGTGATNG